MVGGKDRGQRKVTPDEDGFLCGGAPARAPGIDTATERTIMSHVIIGTAGHIDHGKTALIKALTGIDTDTLPEEQARGVTIDIGFAYWKDNVTIIDVPGHERFVKNMVTGVCTVDLALFVVAADDGAMPQTREHSGILNLLGVRRGIVALTKVDLVEEEWVCLVMEDLEDLFEGTFLEGAPMVAVSSTTGQGIDELRSLLEAEVARVEERPDRGIFRLSVDRVFSVRGFGTVVTGTVLSGQVGPGDRVVLLPADRPLRVRGVQIHGRDEEGAAVGDRAALNLADVEVEEVERGDILAQPGYFSSTYMIDARLYLLSDAPVSLKNRARVHLHLGPREVLARVVLLEAEELPPGEAQLVQFRLESPGVAARGDRFVIRRYSPVQTLGGGIVLDPQPMKHGRFREEVLQTLRGLEQDDPTRVLALRLKTAGFRPRSTQALASEMGMASAELKKRLQALLDGGHAVTYRQAGQDFYMDASTWEDLLKRIQDALAAFHSGHPLRAGIRRDELRLQVDGGPPPEVYEQGIEHLLQMGALKADGPLLSTADHRIRLTPEQDGLRASIRGLIQEGKTAPPDLQELSSKVADDPEAVRAVVAAMQTMGDLVRLEESLLFDPDVLAGVERELVGYLKTHRRIEVSAFRDLVGTTRKYAVPLLNYFDNRGVTVREGDVRVLK